MYNKNRQEEICLIAKPFGFRFFVGSVGYIAIQGTIPNFLANRRNLIF